MNQWQDSVSWKEVTKYAEVEEAHASERVSLRKNVRWHSQRNSINCEFYQRIRHLKSKQSIKEEIEAQKNLN